MKVEEWAYFFLFFAFLISLHQYVNFGSWFEVEDLHHEGLIVTFGFAGLVLLWLKGRRG